MGGLGYHSNFNPDCKNRGTCERVFINQLVYRTGDYKAPDTRYIKCFNFRDSMEDLYSDGNDGPANIEVGSMKMWTSSEDENSDTNEIKIDENRSKTDENSDTDVMIGQE